MGELIGSPERFTGRNMVPAAWAALNESPRTREALRRAIRASDAEVRFALFHFLFHGLVEITGPPPFVYSIPNRSRARGHRA